MQRCIKCKGKDIQRELSFTVLPNSTKPYNQYIYGNLGWGEGYFCAECGKRYDESPTFVEEDDTEQRNLIEAWEDIKKIVATLFGGFPYDEDPTND